METAMPKPPNCLLCDSSVTVDSYFLAGYSLVTCEICGFVRVLEVAAIEVDYDEVYKGEEYNREQILPQQNAQNAEEFAQHPTYKQFFARLKPSSGNRLLDVGCGVGRFCGCASRRGWSVEGIDLSERAVDIALSYHDFPVRVATVEDLLRHPANRFDVVAAFEVLEHLADPRDFLLKVSDLLAKDGQIFCTVPNWDCEAVRKATRADWLPPIHVNFFTLTSLRALAWSSGFTDIVCGINWSDPLPRGGYNLLKWLRRRLSGQKSIPLGLWLHARKKSKEASKGVSL
jgi:2-polyprenyl-3-methyl-5-hydroxy-6-metoxy-1,4-benzoquinol methylase